MDCLNQSQQVGSLSSAVISDRLQLQQQVGVLGLVLHTLDAFM